MVGGLTIFLFWVMIFGMVIYDWLVLFGVLPNPL